MFLPYPSILLFPFPFPKCGPGGGEAIGELQEKSANLQDVTASLGEEIALSGFGPTLVLATDSHSPSPCSVVKATCLALSWIKARTLPAHSFCQCSPTGSPADHAQAPRDWRPYLKASHCLTSISTSLYRAYLQMEMGWVHTSALVLPHHSCGATLCLYPLNHPPSCLLLKLLSSFPVMEKWLWHHILCSSRH